MMLHFVARQCHYLRAIIVVSYGCVGARSIDKIFEKHVQEPLVLKIERPRRCHDIFTYIHGRCSTSEVPTFASSSNGVPALGVIPNQNWSDRLIFFFGCESPS